MTESTGISGNAPEQQAPVTAPARPSGWRRLVRRTARALLVVVAVAVLLVAFHRPLLYGFAMAFRVDNPAPSDAIILLLGGSPHRPQKAAELFRQGVAPRVVFCREKADPTMPLDAAQLTKDYLVKLGVPPGSIEILPEDVASTFDEATRVKGFLKTHPARRITLVTTSFHTRRARWIFNRVLRGREVDVRAAAATDPDFDESNWYRTENGLIFYFNETIKTVFYWLKY